MPGPCPAHCDHCFPDDWHPCRRPRGHTTRGPAGSHACTPNAAELAADRDLVDRGLVKGSTPGR